MKNNFLTGIVTLYVGACASQVTHTIPEEQVQNNLSPSHISTSIFTSTTACLEEIFKSYHWKGDGYIDSGYCQHIPSKYTTAVENITHLLARNYILEQQIVSNEKEILETPQIIGSMNAKLLALHQLVAHFENLYPESMNKYQSDVTLIEKMAKEYTMASNQIKDYFLVGSTVYDTLRESWHTGTISTTSVDQLNQILNHEQEAIELVAAIHDFNATIDMYQMIIELSVKQNQVPGSNTYQDTL